VDWAKIEQMKKLGGGIAFCHPTVNSSFGEELMYIPYILCRPPLKFREIDLELCDDVWTASPEYDVLVHPLWANMKAAQPLWDGIHYRFVDPTELSDNGKVRIGTIAYRYIATYRSLDKQRILLGLRELYHLSTAALVVTSDGFYMFGKRARNGAVDLLGGGVQPDELILNSGIELEENLYKEILEEAGICRSDVDKLTGLGAVVSETSNVILLGLLKLGIQRCEVETRFLSRTDNEMEDLVFVPEAELRIRLEGMSDYRHLIAQLL
jgi:8-oxo-dGTP pyrophosphatase MutT (NUDIX family)